MKNSTTKLTSIGVVNTPQFNNKNYTINYNEGAIQVQAKQKSPIALIAFCILLCFLLAIPVNKTVNLPFHDVTLDNLSNIPYYESYIEDISNSPIPQFTELLETVGSFTDNVEITPWIDAFNYNIINGDWGAFNWAKEFIEIIIYPFIWIYNLWSSAFKVLLLFI